MAPDEPISPAALATGAVYALEVDAAWLICQAVCMPQSRRLQLRLPARAEPPVQSVTNQPLFTRARQGLPVAEPGWTFQSLADPATLSLLVAPPQGVPRERLIHAVFFPAQPNLVKYAPPVWTADGNRLCLRMARVSGGGPLPARVQGVLVLPSAAQHGAKALEVDALLLAAAPDGQK